MVSQWTNRRALPNIKNGTGTKASTQLQSKPSPIETNYPRTAKSNFHALISYQTRFKWPVTSQKATQHPNGWCRSNGGVDHVNLFVYAEQRLRGLTKFHSNTIITVRPNVMPNRSIFHPMKKIPRLAAHINGAGNFWLSVDQVVNDWVRAKTCEVEADRSELPNKLVALAGILSISLPYLSADCNNQQANLQDGKSTINRQIEQPEQKPKNCHRKPREIKSVIAKMK